VYELSGRDYTTSSPKSEWKLGDAKRVEFGLRSVPADSACINVCWYHVHGRRMSFVYGHDDGNVDISHRVGIACVTSLYHENVSLLLSLSVVCSFLLPSFFIALRKTNPNMYSFSAHRSYHASNTMTESIPVAHYYHPALPFPCLASYFPP